MNHLMTSKKYFAIFIKSGKKRTGGIILYRSKRDLWFEKVNIADLPGLLEINEDYVKMVLDKKIGDPLASQFPAHVFIAWDEYRHALVRGLRKRFITPQEIKKKISKAREKIEKGS